MENKIELKKIFSDFKKAYEFKKPFLDAQQKDFEFTLGKQWDDADVQDLKNKGVRALTFNKIRKNIFLLTGIESQNRTDFKAFPEGKEDSLKAEIATALLKNSMKNSRGDYKVSEQFEDGTTCGESYVEPYLDFTQNLLFGKPKINKSDTFCIFVDPNSKEYDLSDAAYIDKLTIDLSKDQLIQLFPDKEEIIEDIEDGKINIDAIRFGEGNKFSAHIQKRDYGFGENSMSGIDIEESREPIFDLLEHYYKKYVPKWVVIDSKNGIKELTSKKEAENYKKANEAVDPQAAATIKILKRMVPEIWVASYIGGHDEILEDKRAWSYPKWKNYPVIPFFARKSTVTLPYAERHFGVQGIARGMIDGQVEYNKRRTQELRILNTSANSGFMAEEGAMVDPENWQKFGATPGIILTHKAGKPAPQKILPTPLSQGHAQLAAEYNSDIREDSGINTDLLAQEGGQDSGRAIALRQKQGLVMVQKLFDNLSQTKKILGKFLLCMIGDIYDVERSVRILGESFIQENFSVPVMMQVQDPQTGQIMEQPQIDPMTGQIAMQVDQKAVFETFNAVLNDPDLQDYDIVVGESASNDIVRYANFQLLMEMAKSGIPIPPEVLIDESLLSSASREKIKAAVAQQQAAAANTANAAPKK